jgi:hypothetical protein
MAEYENDDAAKDTESTAREVSRAHHDARDAAQAEGGWRLPPDRHEKGSFVRTSEYFGTSHKPFTGGF